MIIEFICWTMAIALASSFFLALSDKWRIREWLQVHADAIIAKCFPRYNGDFFNRLFSCNFCCSWWLNVAISLTLLTAVGEWWMLLIPVCATMLTRNLL